MKDDHRDVINKVEELEVRLSLANALVQMWQNAYEALLTWSVNVKALPEFQDTTDIDTAMKLPIATGRRLIVGYLGRVENGIKAAVRRKQIRKV